MARSSLACALAGRSHLQSKSHSLPRKRRAMRVTAQRLALENLESRCLLSATYYVSPTGNDANPGTFAQPFATLQAHVAQLQPGDIMNVQPGTYSGFCVGWDDPGTSIYGAINGTAAAPITIQAAPGSAAGSVIINTRNAKTADGIDLESSNYITIQGFTINNATGLITRAGIRSVTNQNVVIRNNITDHNGTWGIFTGFSQNLLIENNITSNSKTQHGIYVSNSADNPVIRGNISFGNYCGGIQINADASMGGDGIVTNALIENNIIHDNGVGGGAAINLDGVQNSRIQNNLLYNNHASGIALFQIDGATGSQNNIVVNNTILMASGSRWALNINTGSIGNLVYNNILLNDGTRGAITIDSSSLPGFVSDYNAVKNLMTPDDGNSFITLSQWRTTTGQDLHSQVVTSAVFQNAAGLDFHLAAASPVIDAGTTFVTAAAPTKDMEGTLRPSGTSWDIGAYELSVADTTPPVISAVTSANVTKSSAALSWTTNEPTDTLVQYGLTTVYGSSTTLDATLATTHASTLSGLLAGTTYHYRVLSRDAAGNLTTSGDFTFTTRAADLIRPVASLLKPAPVKYAGPSYSFSITYSDDTAISVASLGSTDIRVTGPNGYSQFATLVSVDNYNDGPTRTVTYQILAPDGSWSYRANGTYTIDILADEVSDTSGNYVAPTTLGTFLVNVPRSRK